MALTCTFGDLTEHKRSLGVLRGPNSKARGRPATKQEPARSYAYGLMTDIHSDIDILVEVTYESIERNECTSIDVTTMILPVY